MNDIRRTILLVIFGFSLVMLWDQWQVHNGKPPTFLPSSRPAASAPATPASGASAAVPSTGTAGSASVPPTTSAAAAGAGAVPGGATPVATASERVVVTTDVLKLTFDTQGASLVQSEFIQHDDLTEKDKPFVLLDQSPARVYVAQSGLIGGTFPTHKTPMTFTGDRTLKDGANEMVLRFESADVGGVKLVTTWTLKRGAYDMAVRHDVINTGTAPVSPQLYMQIVRDGNKPPGESSFYSTFTGPAVYTDAKKYQKIDFSDIEKGKADFVKESPNGYIAMVQHYFASAWLLADGVQRDLFARKVDTNLYAVGMITNAGQVAPGSTKSIDARFFVGPQAEKTLEAVAPGLELVKDYGIFTIISKPLYWLLDKLHGILGNWGWAIVALVVLLKAAFYWLNAKAYASMAKMKAINPKIMEMRERLKDKPQEMQQEMMRIYKTEKVNPMGGCFPIVIQIPVFIALYWVLLSSVEMRHAPWIGWIQDLSAPDPWFILPVIMTATSLFQTWLNPTPPDPMQAKLMWIMPLAFSVMFIFFPAGLVLYWITNNTLSIAQQWFINKRLGVLGK
ncbi:membrane protein insertase YidC [Variovorax sp. LT1P1]|uniref:membrane protein insertase YidC n=1 Tax=Variovorax sp. LT1P1 TaxID=3443730 RepID=UPI003F48B1B4